MDLRKVLDYHGFGFPTSTKMGGLTKKDYALTIDTAKEISMLQEQKGKQAKRILLNVKKNSQEHTWSNKIRNGFIDRE
jgi:phage anti-repressor protein